MSESYEFTASEQSWSIALKNSDGDFLWAESFPKGSKIVEVRDERTIIHIDDGSTLVVPNVLIAEPVFSSTEELFTLIGNIVN